MLATTISIIYLLLRFLEMRFIVRKTSFHLEKLVQFFGNLAVKNECFQAKMNVKL